VSAGAEQAAGVRGVTSTRRKALFALLYLSEGAPIGFLWWALPTRFREAGVGLEEITAATALLAVPWTLKFLWAPLLDTLRGPRWGYRSWLLLAQALMVLALAPLAWLDLATQFDVVVALCLAHAFAAATQDVAIDALAVASSDPDERGSLTGWMQVGMLTGRSAFGGGVLWAGAALGQGLVVSGLCLLLVVVGGVVRACDLREPQPPDAGHDQGARRALGVLLAFLRSLRAAVLRWRMLAGLGFALLAGCGFEGTAGVVGPFLIDRGYESGSVGAFLALPAVGLMAGGALLGGYLADRFGKRRLVALAMVVLAATVIGVGWVPVAQPGASFRTAGLLLAPFYAAVGVFTAASYALFMDHTEPAVAATQFTAFMALTNACESWSVLSVGRLAPAWGYSSAFLAMALLSLVALPLLLFMRPPRGEAGEVTAT
jgi:MFS family permease